jgi:AraC-like DNA-binding protein
MADLDARPLLVTEAASVWDVACPGACKHRSDEECVAATHLVFPYRGVYVHHVGRAETVAEANQVVILNEDEPYRVSHPFEGGDACLSIATSTAVLLELAPERYLLTKDRAAFNRSRLRVDTHTQALAARLRHGLWRGFQQVEGLPLYRYQLQQRLARALDRLGERVDLTELALDLGFSSYSHFSGAFKHSYGQTPLQFQRDARVR